MVFELTAALSAAESNPGFRREPGPGGQEEHPFSSNWTYVGILDPFGSTLLRIRDSFAGHLSNMRHGS